MNKTQTHKIVASQQTSPLASDRSSTTQQACANLISSPRRRQIPPGPTLEGNGRLQHEHHLNYLHSHQYYHQSHQQQRHLDHRRLYRANSKLGPIRGYDKQTNSQRLSSSRQPSVVAASLSRRSSSSPSTTRGAAAHKRVIRASEYRNLRQVVPSLKRQRDVGKVEVVTEAARYIDHLHKTLIERFILCGIPESLKGK